MSLMDGPPPHVMDAQEILHCTADREAPVPGCHCQECEDEREYRRKQADAERSRRTL